MIGQNPKAEVEPSFVGGNRDKENQFWNGGCDEQTGESQARLRVMKRKALGQDDRCIQAELCKIPLARKRENTLRRNPPTKKQS